MAGITGVLAPWPTVPGMDRIQPRHLSPRRPAPVAGRTSATTIGLLLLAAIAAAVVAAGLGAGVLLDPSTSRRPPDVTVGSVPTMPSSLALPSTSTAATRPGVGLLPDPSFEAGLAGWRAAPGTRIDRVGSARDGRWAANFSSTAGADPFVIASRVAVVAATVPYVAAVWLRSSHPGTAVAVNLVELRHDRRFAVDTAGAVLDGIAWQRLEVAHDGHHPGDVLALEVHAPGLPGSASVSLDLVDVRADPGMAAG
jgi:hypothetical protein